MPKRIAVIAVHGVADQQPGETATAISELLANLDIADKPAYRALDVQTIQIPVRRIVVPNEHKVVGKTFGERAATLRRGGVDEYAVGERDVNSELMATMLAGYEPSGPDETYETSVHRTVRSRHDGTEDLEVDIFEMYWADLSRLSQSAFRIFAELYQLLFHLGSLGVHAISAAQAMNKNPETDAKWQAWARFQRSAFNGLAVGFVVPNLLLAAVLIVLMALWPPLWIAVSLSFAVGAILLLGAMLYVGFWTLQARRLLWPTFLVISVAIAGGWWTWAQASQAAELNAWAYWVYRVLALEALALSGVLIALILRSYARYRPEVVWIAVAEATLVGLVILSYMWRAPDPGFNTVIDAALRGGETAYVFLTSAWLWFTWYALRAFFAGRKVIKESKAASADELARIERVKWTARLTLALPAALFTVVTVSLWAGFWYAAAGDPMTRGGALEQRYSPKIWFFTPLITDTTNAWIKTEKDWRLKNEHERLEGDGPARVALERRDAEKPGEHYRGPDTVYNVIWAFIGASAGLGFGALIVLLAGAMVITLYAMAPVAIAERFPPKKASSSKPFGAWLDEGYLKLRWAGDFVISGMLFVLPLGVIAMGLPWHWAPAWLASSLPVWLTKARLSELNFTVFQYVGLVLVPGAAGLVVFGGRLKSILLGFREGLDVALDVDNYLREHPLDACPRARMAARYASLLRHVYSPAQQYDGIVIIAHSQGTVLTADLLRFIRKVGLGNPANEHCDVGLAALGSRKVLLFTMGSPLRQLYGQRFPHLYEWARHEVTGPWQEPTTLIDKATGPDPDALGVDLWVNVYRSADYVGRHLWRPDQCDFKFSAQHADEKRPWHVGTFQPAASKTAEENSNRMEYCIGAGAHTHYWDETAPEVALQLDALIART